MSTAVHDQQWTISGAADVTANDGNGLTLDAIEGLEAPEMRIGTEPLPDTDGGAASLPLENAHEITLRGLVAGDDGTVRNLLIVDLIKALQGLRSDCTLTSEGGLVLTGRLRQRLVISGTGFAKDWTVTLLVTEA